MSEHNRLDMRLDVLNEGGSVRMRNILNALKKEGITTLGDLLVKSEDDILKIPSIGRKSCDEIKEFLSLYGLKLGMAVSIYLLDDPASF